MFLNKKHQRQDLPEGTICIVQTLQPLFPQQTQGEALKCF